MNCRHTLASMEAYIVVATRGPQVQRDDSTYERNDYSSAIQRAAALRREGVRGGEGDYARIDVRYACGCRGCL